MARGRPHGRSKSDHRICQEARYARAAEYRDRISISAEQQEARIGPMNAECSVEDAPRRRRGQKLRDSKTNAGAARMSAGGHSCKAADSAKRKAKKRLEHSLGKAAERDPHTLHCHACGATAEVGLRGGKEGGEVEYFCRGHTPTTGCFPIDRDRGDWAEEREMRCLRAEERRLEEELRNLGGASSTAKSTSSENGFHSAGSWASMPMSQLLIGKLLIIGGIESNPGPPSDQPSASILVTRESTGEVVTFNAPKVCKEVLKSLVVAEGWGEGVLSAWIDGRRRNYLDDDMLHEREYVYRALKATSTGQPGPSAVGTRVRGPQALSDFWLALHRAEISHFGKVLSLVDGTSFLGDPWLGKKLYYRDCYEGLEQELKQIFDQKDGFGQRAYSAVAIIGNPGIGKSLFGYMLLYRWAREGRRVVVVKENVFHSQPMLLTAEGAFKLDDDALDYELRDTEVRYLVDSLNPGGVGPLPTKAQMVLVTSPDIEVYQEVWKRSGYTRRYMDTWSWEELAKCHQSIFPQQSLGEVQARYDRWGGIPRYVLEKLEKADQDLLDADIGKTNLTKLIAAAGAPDSHQSASHKLLHMRVDSDFLTTWMEMASPYVSEKVAYKLWEKEKEALQRFLSVSAGEKGPEAFRGNLWEGFCHRKLAEGGAFRIRDFSAPSSRVQEVKLGRSTTHIFDDWKEVESLPDGQYFRPRSKSMGSVDSGMQPNILFQITVNDDHDLKCLPLQKAFDSMKSKKQSGSVNVFFVNPPDIFHRMKATKIGQGPGGGNLRVAVKQYALEVPF